MPIARFQMPDGRIARFEVPEGTTPEQAQALMEQAVAGGATKKPAPKPQTSTMSDLGYSGLAGLGSLIQFPGQVYGLATGDMDNSLSNLGQSIQEYAAQKQSAGLAAKRQARDAAVKAAAPSGVAAEYGTAAWQTIKDPYLLANEVAENVINMMPSALLTRGAMALGMRMAAKRIGESALDETAKRTALAAVRDKLVKRVGVPTAVGTGAAQQGADVGGDTYQAVYERLIQQGVDPETAKQQALALARGAATSGTALSAAAQLLPGARALERAFAGARGVGGRMAGLAKGALGEAVSETAEEGSGRVLQNAALRNVDPTQDLMEGVGATAGQAGVVGGVMGGAAGVRNSYVGEQQRLQAEALQQAAQQQQATAQQLAQQQDPNYIRQTGDIYMEKVRRHQELLAAAKVSKDADPMAQEAAKAAQQAADDFYNTDLQPAAEAAKGIWTQYKDQIKAEEDAKRNDPRYVEQAYDDYVAKRQEHEAMAQRAKELAKEQDPIGKLAATKAKEDAATFYAENVKPRESALVPIFDKIKELVQRREQVAAAANAPAAAPAEAPAQATLFDVQQMPRPAVQEEVDPVKARTELQQRIQQHEDSVGALLTQIEQAVAKGDNDQVIRLSQEAQTQRKARMDAEQALERLKKTAPMPPDAAKLQERLRKAAEEGNPELTLKLAQQLKAMGVPTAGTAQALDLGKPTRAQSTESASSFNKRTYETPESSASTPPRETTARDAEQMQDLLSDLDALDVARREGLTEKEIAEMEQRRLDTSQTQQLLLEDDVVSPLRTVTVNDRRVKPKQKSEAALHRQMLLVDALRDARTRKDRVAMHDILVQLRSERRGSTRKSFAEAVFKLRQARAAKDKDAAKKAMAELRAMQGDAKKGTIYHTPATQIERTLSKEPTAKVVQAQMARAGDDPLVQAVSEYDTAALPKPVLQDLSTYLHKKRIGQDAAEEESAVREYLRQQEEGKRSESEGAARAVQTEIRTPDFEQTRGTIFDTPDALMDYMAGGALADLRKQMGLQNDTVQRAHRMLGLLAAKVQKLTSDLEAAQKQVDAARAMTPAEREAEGEAKLQAAEAMVREAEANLLDLQQEQEFERDSLAADLGKARLAHEFAVRTAADIAEQIASNAARMEDMAAHHESLRTIAVAHRGLQTALEMRHAATGPDAVYADRLLALQAMAVMPPAHLSRMRRQLAREHATAVEQSDAQVRAAFADLEHALTVARGIPQTDARITEFLTQDMWLRQQLEQEQAEIAATAERVKKTTRALNAAIRNQQRRTATKQAQDTAETARLLQAEILREVRELRSMAAAPAPKEVAQAAAARNTAQQQLQERQAALKKAGTDAAEQRNVPYETARAQRTERAQARADELRRVRNQRAALSAAERLRRETPGTALSFETRRALEAIVKDGPGMLAEYRAILASDIPTAKDKTRAEAQIRRIERSMERAGQLLADRTGASEAAQKLNQSIAKAEASIAKMEAEMAAPDTTPERRETLSEQKRRRKRGLEALQARRDKKHGVQRTELKTEAAQRSLAARAKLLGRIDNLQREIDLLEDRLNEGRVPEADAAREQKRLMRKQVALLEMQDRAGGAQRTVEEIETAEEAGRVSRERMEANARGEKPPSLPTRREGPLVKAAAVSGNLRTGDTENAAARNLSRQNPPQQGGRVRTPKLGPIMKAAKQEGKGTELERLEARRERARDLIHAEAADLAPEDWENNPRLQRLTAIEKNIEAAIKKLQKPEKKNGTRDSEKTILSKLEKRLGAWSPVAHPVDGLSFAEAAQKLSDMAGTPAEQRPLFRALAAAFTRGGVSFGTVRTGAFVGPVPGGSYIENTIYSPPSLLLHELTHAATVLGLKTDAVLDSKVTSLRNRVLAWVGSPAGVAYMRANPRAEHEATPGEPYGTKNNAEFVAETFSNPEFRALLRSIPLSGDKKKHALSRFIDFVAEHLGLSKDTQKTALAEAIELAGNAMEVTAKTRVPADKWAPTERLTPVTWRKQIELRDGKQSQYARIMADPYAEGPEADDAPVALRSRGTGDPLSKTAINAARNGDAQLVALDIATQAKDAFQRRVAATIAPLMGEVRVHLVETTTADNPDAPGASSESGRTIFLNRNTGLTEDTALHELTHATTLFQLRRPEAELAPAQIEAKRELEALHARAKADPAMKNEVVRDGDVAEFVAEGLGSRRMAAYLAGIAVDNRTGWQKFKDAVLRLLGIKTPPQPNARDRLLELAERFMAPPGETRTRAEQPSALRKSDIDTSTPMGKLASTLTARPRSFADRWFKDLFQTAEMQLVDMRAPLAAALKAGNADRADQALYYVRKADQRMAMTYAALAYGPLGLKKDRAGMHSVEAGHGPSAKDVFEAIGKIPGGSSEQKFAFAQAYMAAQRAQRVGWDKLNFSDPSLHAAAAAALQQVNADPALKSALENVRKVYNKYNEGLVGFLAASGAIPKAKAAELLSHGDYVPFYRVDSTGNALLDMGEGLTLHIGDIRNQPYLQALDKGDDKLLPLNEAIIRNTMLLTDMGMRNLATKDVAYALQDLGRPAKKMVIRRGRGGTGTNVLRFQQEPDPADPEDKGFRHVIIDTEGTPAEGINSALLARSLEGAYVTVSGLTKLASGFADILRAGVTRSPMYVARQLVRDPMAAAFTSGMDSGMLGSVMGTMAEFSKQMAGKSPGADTLLRKGVIQSGIFTGDPDDMAKFAKLLATGDVSAYRHVLNALDRTAMKADAATRTRVYESALKQGQSDVRAELAAIEMMNFNKRGANPAVQALSRMVPFFNAQIQGLNVLYKAATGQMPLQDRLKIKEKFWNRALLLMGATLAYAAAWEDEDEYKNADPYIRYNNFFVKVGDTTIKLPIPFEVGMLFKALPEMLMDNAKGKFTDAEWKGIRQLILQQVPGNGLPLPQAVKPMLENIANYSFFTQRQLETDDQQRRLVASERVNKNTTELAKALSRSAESMGVDVSPIKIENFVRGHLGGLPIAAAMLLNEVLSEQASGVERPAPRASERPLIGVLVQEQYGGGPVNAAYAKAQAVEQAMSTYKAMVDGGRKAEAEQFKQNVVNMLADDRLTKTFRAQMQALAKREGAVRSSGLSADEKREKLDAVLKRRHEVSRHYLEALDAVSAAVAD